MKRKVLLLIISSFMIMGVVSAASLWGNYKGNQIIRLTVDGVPVKVSDAPSVSMDGRTMIPIYLLQQAGVKYEWDQKNQTVNITPSTNISQNDLSSLYAKISNHYNRLRIVGDILWETGDRFMDARTNIKLGQDPKSSITHASDSMTNAVDKYNSLLKSNELIVQEALSNNIDISDTNDILNNYFAALDYYGDSILGLTDYVMDNSQTSYNKYMDNLKLGDNQTDEGRSASADKFQSYLDKVIYSK